MDRKFWIILVISLIIGSLGIINTLYLSFCICGFLFSCLISTRWIFSSESDQFYKSIKIFRLSIPNSSLKGLDIKSPWKEANGKLDRRITGSSLIDEQLQSLVNLFFRDFVVSWYGNISSNPTFENELKKSVLQTLVSLSSRFKSADWASFLTTRLVDDVASHFRLFKDAKAEIKSNKEKSSLIDRFFDKEAEKEKDICRDNICLKQEGEKEFLSDLVELLLYFILPAKDFDAMPLRSILIEILVASVAIPLVNLVSDPDFINSIIIMAGKDIHVTSELFIMVIRSSNNSEELEAVRKSVTQEINLLRSRDSGNRDEGNEIKQKLGSVEYLRRVIDARMARLNKGEAEPDSLGLPDNFEIGNMSRGRLFQLPLDAIMKNSLTLDHFMKYMASIDHMHYVNLYLNIECWKAAVTERLCALELERIHHLQESAHEGVMPGLQHDYFSAVDLSNHKEEAEVMYSHYLSEKASSRVFLDSSVVNRLILRIRSEKLNELWFDEVHKELFNTLKDVDKFLPAFRRSVWYIRLLAELDLLKDLSRSDDEDSHSFDDTNITVGSEQSDEVDSGEGKSVSRSSSCSHSPSPSLTVSPSHTRSQSLTTRGFTLTANISGSEIVREGNKSHAIYRVCVTRKNIYGQEELWHVFRRYSEFYDFESTLCSKFMDLSSVPFPSKKMLNNLAVWFLEKRTNELNEWLTKILVPATLQSHPGMQDMFFKFLDHTPYHSSHQPNLAKRVEDNLVTPLRVGVKNVSERVKSVPDCVFSSVHGTVDGLYRKLLKPQPSQGRYSAISHLESSPRGSIDIEGEENLPLRIVLLLMDEVFDLGSKDQWFRRKFILFLKQIIKAMFGDIVNRRIVEGVSYISSPERVASYIKSLKNTIWPNGELSLSSTNRTVEERHRAQVAARATMLASISDEFKAILGSQTTSRGVLGVYECVQWQVLNKRLLYVLVEAVFEYLFDTYREIPGLVRSLKRNSSRIPKRTHSRKPSRLL